MMGTNDKQPALAQQQQQQQQVNQRKIVSLLFVIWKGGDIQQ
jgi:hypothetical protein